MDNELVVETIRLEPNLSFQNNRVIGDTIAQVLDALKYQGYAIESFRLSVGEPLELSVIKIIPEHVDKKVVNWKKELSLI